MDVWSKTTPCLFPLAIHHHQQASDQDFNLFHSIDRKLYARIIRTLNRNPIESAQIMAFFIFLEREVRDFNLINKMLSLETPILKKLVDEAWMCFTFIESGMLLPNQNNVDIATLRDLVNDPGLTLIYFHRHRFQVSMELRKILDTVCWRAFNDVIAMHDKDRTKLSNEVMKVPQDDRTVFLTFSKGYPLKESEIMEFFTRKFGDTVEELIMQEVGEEDQVLYAKMVVRRKSEMETIVRGHKAKYTINGKHVWARKYVKRQHQPFQR